MNNQYVCEFCGRVTPKVWELTPENWTEPEPVLLCADCQRIVAEMTDETPTDTVQ